MKQPKTRLWCVMAICLTLIIIVLLTRDSLCELRVNSLTMEIVAVLACSMTPKQ